MHAVNRNSVFMIAVGVGMKNNKYTPKHLQLCLRMV